MVTSQGALTASALSEDNGVISGVAWIDANSNGIQEPSEALASGVIIEVHTLSGTLAGTASTDESGAYVITGLAYGIYHVSGIEHDNTMTTEQTVELNEINGAANVDIAMKEQVMTFQFLPLVRR